MDRSSEKEKCPFFDTHEDIGSTSEPNFNTVQVLNSNSNFDNWIESCFQYDDVWMQSLLSVEERRRSFSQWMRSGFGHFDDNSPVDVCSDVNGQESDRIREISGSHLMNKSSLDEEFYSILSCWSTDNSNFVDDLGLKENFASSQDEATVSEAREDGLSLPGGLEELENSLGPLSEDKPTSTLAQAVKRIKGSLLGKFRFTGEKGKNERDLVAVSKVHRVKVRQNKKQLKELSALYLGQDIKAHEGAILAMKFSPDGQYLASGGEDGVVRLWQVVEDERCNRTDVPDLDPSCIYFTVNHLSELKPLAVNKEVIGKPVRSRKTSESACVIFPPRVFRILEKPLHEFYGHSGEILDLSWSKINHLVSSSVDKTVRLWRMGSEDCVRVFSHNNYVTSVHFNPVNDDHFISGSIDGKVRIWGISCGQVVGWTDVREIVTAVCYRPDGQGGVVGSMTGNCRFYDISDNQLQLYAQICLHNKKKSPCRKITGFQFFPQDSGKLMVTCADSQVRILHGLNVIGKYQGLRCAGNQTLASLTSDGKHIISACGDSNVYIWYCKAQNEPFFSQGKKIRSYEYFASNASIALPWLGLKRNNATSGTQLHASDDTLPEVLTSPSGLSLSQEFFLETFPKGSATWPEEKLPTYSSLADKPSRINRSQYKFLKASCGSTSGSHAWGLVIVTAGWDGHIKSFQNYGLPIPV